MTHTYIRWFTLALFAVQVVCTAALARVAQEDAQRPEVPVELQAAINRAIDRGVESLLEQQELDGSWRHDLAGYGPGATGLAVYTLLKCGLASDHLAVSRGMEFMRRYPPYRTYTSATVMMAIGARGDARDKPWMQEHLDALLSWRQASGWGYPDGRPDLSNTQFAGLGLRAAAVLGVQPKTRHWEDLAKDALDYLEDKKGVSGDKAGFYYERGGERHPTGSMTAAGLTLAAIALEYGPGTQKQALQRAQKRALAWLGEHFSAQFNPMPEAANGQGGWHYYYLYGIERVGSLFGVERFGQHPWYEEGARLLVEKQEGDGRWGNQADTCFALLFLARATGQPKAAASGLAVARAAQERGLYGTDDPAVDVSLRASGTGELTFWVSSFGDRVKLSYAPDDEGKAPLPVRRVEYFIQATGDTAPPESFGVVLADPAAPRSDARFAVKHTPIGPASYDVFVEVTLVDFADGREVTLQSKPLTVRAALQQHQDLLTYARDFSRNDLLSDKVSFTVMTSSKAEGDNALPRLAADGLQATAWRCAPEDGAPWLRLEFARPPRAGTLALTQAFDPSERGIPARAGRARITWNSDEKAALTVDLVRDPRRKTLVDLPQGLRLRTLHIELLARTDNRPIGFSEIELFTKR